MKISVIGCGSIGKRHIRNLSNLEDNSINNITVYDINSESFDSIKDIQNIKITQNINEVYENASGIIIANPNHLHSKYALEALENNCNIMVEKPFSHSLTHINEILEIAQNKNLVVKTAYMLRFYEPMIKLKEIIDKKILGKIYSANIMCGNYLPDWRPHLDYRKNYGAKKNQGGGIILDATHEINYARYLLGEVKKVSCFASKLSNLEIDTEDVASINLIFENECIANIHLDYLQHNYNRNCTIVCEKGTLIWNFIGHQLDIYEKETKKWINIIKLKDYDFNNTYIEEIKDFISLIKLNRNNYYDTIDGINDLKIALASLESAKNFKCIDL